MDTAPLARQAVTITGSISGVRPMAMEMAKSTACSQFPFTKPFSSRTTGTMNSISRTSSQDTEFIPFSKEVSVFFSASLPAMPPRTVPSPTAATTPLALPLTTLLPVKTRQRF